MVIGREPFAYRRLQLRPRQSIKFPALLHNPLSRGYGFSHFWGFFFGFYYDYVTVAVSLSRSYDFILLGFLDFIIIIDDEDDYH